MIKDFKQIYEKARKIAAANNKDRHNKLAKISKLLEPDLEDVTNKALSFNSTTIILSIETDSVHVYYQTLNGGLKPLLTRATADFDVSVEDLFGVIEDYFKLFSSVRISNRYLYINLHKLKASE